jgi:hypothetical protein
MNLVSPCQDLMGKTVSAKAKKISAILATGDDFTWSILVSGHKTICVTFAASIKSIIAINIEFPFDCCIIQAGQLVRRDQKCKTWRRQNTKYNLPIHQNGPSETTTPHLRPFNSICIIYIQFLFDWCIIQAGQLVRRDQRCKTWKRQNTKYKLCPFLKISDLHQ